MCPNFEFAIKVFPFYFKEFLRYYNLTDNYSAFDCYLKEGGMAGSYLIFVMPLRFIRFAATIFKARNTFILTINTISVITHFVMQSWELRI